jgi:predicted NUDIX family phosphoesterase
MINKKIVLVFNGYSASGKDTIRNHLCEYLEAKYNLTTYKFTSMDLTNEIFMDKLNINPFTNKTKEKRNFLANHKKLLVEYGNLPNIDFINKVKKLDGNIFTTMIREKEEILNLKELCKKEGFIFKFIYIENRSVKYENIGNDADDLVPLTKDIADYIFYNDFDKNDKDKKINIFILRQKIKKAIDKTLIPELLLEEKMSEEVMCIKRNSVPCTYIEKDTMTYLKSKNLCLLEKEKYFIKRSICEYDKEYKQLIPYVLIRLDNKFLTFKRNGTEQRLHGEYSIGIGGHVSKGESFYNAIFREIKEELGTIPDILDMKFIGYINDEKNEVSSYHLGLVYLIDIDKWIDSNFDIEEELGGKIEFLSKEELDAKNIESWGRLSLNLV